jgi:hypothetical protein
MRINPLEWSHFLKFYANPWLKINSIGNQSMVTILKLLSYAMAKVNFSHAPPMVTNFNQTINTQVFKSVVKK